MAESMYSRRQTSEPKKRTDRPSSFSMESMKVISESIGVNRMSEDTLQCLAEEATYRLKEVLQVIRHI